MTRSSPTRLGTTRAARTGSMVRMTDEPTPDDAGEADPALAVTDRVLLRARALVLHDLAARGG